MGALNEALKDLKEAASGVASALGVEARDRAARVFHEALDRLTPEFVENAVREHVKSECAALLPGLVSEAVHKYFQKPSDNN